MSRAIFENLCMVCYIIVCFLCTILYDVIRWLFDCFSLVSKLRILDTRI
jgi:hypothetical protein